MKNFKNKSKIFWSIFNIIFVCIILNMIVNTVLTYKDVKNLENNKTEQKKEIQNLKEERKRLQEELASLEKEETIEKIARDKIYMKKKGEVIYRLVD